jgi:hypothetical protein
MLCPEYQIRQSVEAFEKCGLSASSWTKDDEYFLRVNVKANIPKGLKGLIIEIEILDNYLVILRHESPSGPMTDISIE